MTNLIATKISDTVDTSQEVNAAKWRDDEKAERRTFAEHIDRLACLRAATCPDCKYCGCTVSVLNHVLIPMREGLLQDSNSLGLLESMTDKLETEMTQLRTYANNLASLLQCLEMDLDLFRVKYSRVRQLEPGHLSALSCEGSQRVPRPTDHLARDSVSRQV